MVGTGELKHTDDNQLAAHAHKHTHHTQSFICTRIGQITVDTRSIEWQVCGRAAACLSGIRIVLILYLWRSLAHSNGLRRFPSLAQPMSANPAAIIVCFADFPVKLAAYSDRPGDRHQFIERPLCNIIIMNATISNTRVY